MGVPAGGGEDLAVGAVPETLLARVLGLAHFERLEVGVPDVFAEGQRVLGEDGVGGRGDVVVFGRGDGHGEDWGGVRLGGWIWGGGGRRGKNGLGGG